MNKPKLILNDKLSNQKKIKKDFHMIAKQNLTKRSSEWPGRTSNQLVKPEILQNFKTQEYFI